MYHNKKREINPTVGFNANISPDLMEQVKASGHKYSHIVKLGVLAIANNPQMREQIIALEMGNMKLQEKLSAVSARLAAFEKGKEGD